MDNTSSTNESPRCFLLCAFSSMLFGLQLHGRTCWSTLWILLSQESRRYLPNLMVINQPFNHPASQLMTWARQCPALLNLFLPDQEYHIPEEKHPQLTFTDETMEWYWANMTWGPEKSGLVCTYMIYKFDIYIYYLFNTWPKYIYSFVLAVLKADVEAS